MHPQAPLFRILDLQKGPVASCTLGIETGHPILQGHFPGQPVVPGACIVRAIHDAVELATGRRLVMTEASQIKFLLPLNPERNPKASLQLLIEAIDGEALKVSATLGWEDQVFTKFRGTFREG
jgi:3-hydroxyacyl-[acyl-carrier-protein] dehydratase